jgi:hypothetical protein
VCRDYLGCWGLPINEGRRREAVICLSKWQPTFLLRDQEFIPSGETSKSSSILRSTVICAHHKAYISNTEKNKGNVRRRFADIPWTR